MTKQQIRYWSKTNNAWLKVFATQVEDKVVLLTFDEKGKPIVVKVLGILDYNRMKAEGKILDGWGE